MLTPALNVLMALWKSELGAVLAKADEHLLAKDQEQVLKLTGAQISKTLSQFRAQVLAEDHPAAALREER